MSRPNSRAQRSAACVATPGRLPHRNTRRPAATPRRGHVGVHVGDRDATLVPVSVEPSCHHHRMAVRQQEIRAGDGRGHRRVLGAEIHHVRVDADDRCALAMASPVGGHIDELVRTDEIDGDPPDHDAIGQRNLRHCNPRPALAEPALCRPFTRSRDDRQHTFTYARAFLKRHRLENGRRNNNRSPSKQRVVARLPDGRCSVGSATGCVGVCAGTFRLPAYRSRCDARSGTGHIGQVAGSARAIGTQRSPSMCRERRRRDRPN